MRSGLSIGLIIACLVASALAAGGVTYLMIEQSRTSLYEAGTQYSKGTVQSVDTKNRSLVIMPSLPYREAQGIRMYVTDDARIISRTFVMKNGIISGTNDVRQDFLESIVPGDGIYALFWLDPSGKAFVTNFIIVGDTLPGF